MRLPPNTPSPLESPSVLSAASPGTGSGEVLEGPRDRRGAETGGLNGSPTDADPSSPYSSHPEGTASGGTHGSPEGASPQGSGDLQLARTLSTPAKLKDMALGIFGKKKSKRELLGSGDGSGGTPRSGGTTRSGATQGSGGTLESDGTVLSDAIKSGRLRTSPSAPASAMRRLLELKSPFSAASLATSVFSGSKTAGDSNSDSKPSLGTSSSLSPRCDSLLVSFAPLCTFPLHP